MQVAWSPVPLRPLPAGHAAQAPVTRSHLASRPAVELDWPHALLHSLQLVMPAAGAYVPVEQAAGHKTSVSECRRRRVA